MSDLLNRIKSLLPNGWFQTPTPVLDTALSGVAGALSTVRDLTDYARSQTRISTATDVFLDLIGLDFFGGTLPRRSMESDAAYRTRIQAQLLLERGTRGGMIRALQLLTGRTPIIFEPSRPADTGGYNTNAMGYGVAGAYGSLSLPFQSFITAYRPTGTGVPLVAGYNSPQGAYNAGSRAEYVGQDMISGAVTDADIYAAIAAASPVGTISWTLIIS